MLQASAAPDVVHWPQISYINQTRHAAGRDVTAPTCPRTISYESDVAVFTLPISYETVTSSK